MNFSWNNGVDGASNDPAIAERRRNDVRALLATLFVSRGTPMLTAGDEFGRTQGGNNNAYAQDNPTTWLDWEGADHDLTAFAGRLMALRKTHRSLAADSFLTGKPLDNSSIPDAVWLRPKSGEMTEADWINGGRVVGLALYVPATRNASADRIAIWINSESAAGVGWLPPPRPGHRWTLAMDTANPMATTSPAASGFALPARSVSIFAELKA